VIIYTKYTGWRQNGFNVHAQVPKKQLTLLVALVLVAPGEGGATILRLPHIISRPLL
jgi:hypothetical protein